MSELKAGVIHTPHDEGMTFVTDSDTISVNERETEFYIKSEADKVIADLEESHNKEVGQLLIKIAEQKSEIERLEILCANYIHDCDNLAISNEQAKRAARTLLKNMNHNKRKRCLALADYAEAESCHHTTLANGFWLLRNDITKRDEERRIAKRWDKWQNRWLALADEFKEAK